MRITTAGTNTELISQLQSLETQQNTLQTQVSTGQRVSQPGDDPFAVSQVVADQMEGSALTQAGLNANTALADSQNTSAALTQLKSLSDSASQLAVTASGATGPQAMQNAAVQVNQLLEQAVNAGNATSGGNYLFAGTALTTSPFTVTRDPTSGQITSVAYAGSANSVNVPLGDGTSVQPGTDATTNAALASFMNQLVTLRNSLQSGDATAAQGTATPLADANDAVVGAIGDQAEVQSQIQLTQTRQQTQLTNLGQDIATATAVDMPTAITKLNLASEAYQAALESAAQFMNVSLLNYIH